MWEFIVPNSLWKLSGSCANSDHPDLWYSTNPKEKRQAKKICYRCPVIAQCLIASFENNEAFGIWGGLDEQERKRARKR